MKTNQLLLIGAVLLLLYFLMKKKTATTTSPTVNGAIGGTQTLNGNSNGVEQNGSFFTAQFGAPSDNTGGMYTTQPAQTNVGNGVIH